MSATWSVAAAVGDALGSEVVADELVGGGDVAEAHRVSLGDGRTVFAKTKRDAPPLFFDTEARGLRWLGAARALPVPEVLFVGETKPLLVLAWIETDEGYSGQSDDAAFGRALAELHRAGAPCFGREDRRTTGSRGLPNEPAEQWVDFYAQCRLLPLAKLAADTHALSGAAIAGLEHIAATLDRFGAAAEPAARLHGDLWAGNRLVDRHGSSWLIDPASHGGHREFDLAMMQLFGGWTDHAFAAYDEAWPLTQGWHDRVALHQLAPLAVHAIKFGGGYVRATEGAIERYR